MIIAEYQCDDLYRGQKLALLEFLPLDAENWITCGNALRLDWLKICPPTGTGVKITSDDLFSTPLDQTEMDFENEGGETFICGNPPYAGTRNQSNEQKDDAKLVMSEFTPSWRTLDYVAGWLLKSAKYLQVAEGRSAFVTTNSVCQGSQVPVLWGAMEKLSVNIQFAHTAFKWANLAAHNAGVTVIILGLQLRSKMDRKIYSVNELGTVEIAKVPNINGYLAPAANIFVEKTSKPIFDVCPMERGNAPVDGGHLIFDEAGRRTFARENPSTTTLFRIAVNGNDFVKGKSRSVIYVQDPEQLDQAQVAALSPVAQEVSQFRLKSPKEATRKLAKTPFRFGENRPPTDGARIFIPNLHSERRDYLTMGLLNGNEITLAPHFDLEFPDLSTFGILCSRIHLIWIATVCGKLETRYRYSNTLGWNTFPIPKLTNQNRGDLIRCAESILLCRESHFPTTIAELYAPDKMPTNLREAHQRNDETLERIYIGRRFKNDTERLEKLFEMYSRMTN